MKFLKKLFRTWKINFAFMCTNVCKENNFFKDQIGEWYGTSCRK